MPVFIVFLILLFFQPSHSAPVTLTYQGRIVRADGTPLEHQNISFLFKITDPSGQCVIYQEYVTGIDMTNSKGVFDVPIGTGNVSWPTGGSFSILDSFNNNSVFSCGSCSGYTCVSSGGTYSAVNTDSRLLRVQFNDGHSWKAISPDNVIRTVPYAAFSLAAQKLGDHGVNAFVLKDSVNGNASCDSGSFLTWNATTKSFGCAGVSGSAGGTVTDVTVASPLAVSNGQSTPHITIQAASNSQHGYLTSTDWTTFNNKLGASTSFGGDVSGTAANISVDKIKNTPLSFSSLANGHILKYSAGSWVNGAISVSDISDLSTNLAGKPDYAQFPTSCTAAQTMTFVSPVGGFTCTNIAIPASQVSGNISGTAAGFSGSLSGDVTGTQSSTTVTKIRNVNVATTTPNAGDVLRYDAGTSSWVPASLPSGSGGGVSSVSATSPLSSSGGDTPSISLAGLSGLGTSHQLLGMNNGASGYEYKTLNGTTQQVIVSHAAGSITLSTPQNIHTAATPTFAGMTLSSLSAAGIRVVASDSAGALTGLASANNAILTTNGSGVPGFQAISGDIFNQYVLQAGRTGGQTIYGGTAASETLTINSTSNSTRGYVLVNPNGGHVGIGTTTPVSRLQVNGDITNAGSVNNTSVNVNFSSGNLQHTALNCQSFVLNNMKDGGAYTFAVKGTSVATCSFTAYSGLGTGALTVHMPIDHGATTSAKHTLYNFLVLGSDVYVSWSPGL
ncbi:hypothetical protein AZI86_01045 [Bdellovibrio bacteriovorus]|uniref:Cell wall surface anchor family protein n=1 Tax=Bdellovibrio bacteriovorus TaxID=959 RepID=A0A150WMK3_BDEBC|nr:hypothetical protein [Bdellovibrio bacteriovorus]KYG65692.1 hypothetical protein AZI86_01045 [Bdellovibrio bacteriovorus]